MALETDRKVYFIPDGMIYDYGYQGQTGKSIIYKEGERNMQDSFAVDQFNLSLIRKIRKILWLLNPIGYISIVIN